MNLPRVTLLCGHYGSGKTQIALNLAFLLRQTHKRVALVDLDIVNPYFRSNDHAAALERAGIRLIVSSLAGTNVESPGLNPECAAMLDDSGLHCVLDVGGDDRGAYALGRYAKGLNAQAEALMVINMYRPLTAKASEVLETMRKIEAAGHVRLTGIVNNSNLGAETRPQDVLDSLPYAEEVSALTGLEVKFTTVRSDLAVTGIDNLFPIRIYEKEIWRL